MAYIVMTRVYLYVCAHVYMHSHGLYSYGPRRCLIAIFNPKVPQHKQQSGVHAAHVPHQRCSLHTRASRRDRGHNYTGHNYIDHNYRGHNYVGHNYLGHNLIGHNLVGHNYSGHNCIGHIHIGTGS